VIRGFEEDGTGFAGLIVCSIFANEGLPDVPRGFMARATEIVHAAGGLVIADEVQAGYCRSGVWWGYDVLGFRPDIVVTGKPMGNGLPLAATAASRKLVETSSGRDALLQHLRLQPAAGGGRHRRHRRTSSASASRQTSPRWARS
jgi:4-aminobutyrate aminotransferase-like enzyme